MEVLVMREGLISLSVFEQDMQAVILGGGHLVNNIIPKPVFPRQLTETLHLPKNKSQKFN